MARLFMMTWIEAKKCWNKHYKGKMYCVTTKALGVPPTPLASYEAANTWWLAKQAEIDASQPATRNIPTRTAYQGRHSCAMPDHVGNN